MSTNEEKVQESLARIREKKNNEKIILPEVDLSEFKELKFKEDNTATELPKYPSEKEEAVSVKGKLPKSVDFSKCSKVSKEMD